MFFPGTPNIFVPGDSVFMLFKCMCNNISIEKKINKENYHPLLWRKCLLKLNLWKSKFLLICFWLSLYNYREKL